jgi:nucleotide-binding universal stress UspA family protein
VYLAADQVLVRRELMGKILCATRGGEASLLTQQAAIELAKQNGDELVFVYIYDVEFLSHARYVLRSDVVEDAMDNMAEFLMTMAVERAGKAGVTARYIIRHGQIDEQLIEAAIDEKATLVVLGKPADDEGRFDAERLAELVARLREATGIEFRVLPD